MNRNILKLLTVISVFSIFITNFSISAFANQETKVINDKSVLYENNIIVDGGFVYIDGQKNNLYVVFENDYDAINEAENNCLNLLSALSKEYKLEKICDKNISEYRTAMYMFLDSEDNKSFEDSNEEVIYLKSFFDIYENKEKNKRILELINSRKNVLYDTNEFDEDLSLLLPFSEPYAQKYIGINTEISTYSYSASAAVKYANKYAVVPNLLEYYFFDEGDCANFASQILGNGGVNQAVYDSTAKGWWHKYSGGKHSHSQSWTMADTFARYQGVKYTTTSNNSFHSNLKQGNFIVADYQQDGDWDHCGFVTDKSTTQYKVAQHTSNYNEWSSKCSWAGVGSKGGKYGRVRY